MNPPDFCDACWKGVITNQLGLLSSPVEQQEILGPTTGGYAYKVSGKALKAGADQRCRWCALLVKWCSSAFDFKNDKEAQVRVGKGAGSEGQHVFSIYVNDRICWFGYAYTMEDDLVATYIPGRNLYVDIGTKDALSLAQKLMNDCIDNHNDCPSPLNPPPVLPSRVIDCSDPVHPRLLITSDQRDHYVALSYVWGEDITTKLTASNLEAYTHAIPIKDQPQTLQDAILTTHRLGVRHLWIDSLCIIQEGDADADKGRELQRMTSYYRDAYVAIIAASAPKVSTGFLQARKDTFGAASLAFPFVVPHGTAPGVVYLSSWMAGAPKYEPEREPIHGRAWCMQEYFLSPRALVFATPTLQYRCHKGTRNIAGADNAHWVSSEREPVPSRDLPTAPTTPDEKQKIQKAWKLTIANYTKRKVSRPTDKLVAFASLAEVFPKSVPESRYYAGLWGATLLFDLLWSKDSGKHYPSRPAAYRAPSWSWASLDGEINPGNAYFNDKVELVAEVKKCETTPANPKLPFGEITAATLVLSAKVVADCVMKPHWAVYHLRDKGELGHDNEWIDDDSGERIEEIGLGRLDSSDDDIHSGVRWVWVVIIYCREDILNPGTSVVQGLLVEPVSSGTLTGAEAKFRRIGFFERSDETSTVDEWLEKVTKVEIEIV
ncbi:hypothetical protein HYPSUDRAFT_784646 [Hypholoma sublateritium FD-334 SS-4]|uniref:Heterokaryon incompatibility domain-containing protein n=1 Tax=Hypholoma sublateritium (strain FD-334 SS-4) TaxID=945553 RepID=A0A0D2MAW4_HYPSF|nr:hypothetical protein HYPSUDRAFT_784646 [Hypholoma sublateritium FD-334 SS-4]